MLKRSMASTISNGLVDKYYDIAMASGAKGGKLLGAGGGGFMYMVAKDPQAALRIREMLTENPLAPNARFVEMSISDKGLQISRS